VAIVLIFEFADPDISEQDGIPVILEQNRTFVAVGSIIPHGMGAAPTGISR